tara:strand:+ start:742 stop:1023 length:282 start_codon:yes stop_codon:yes gene_type:complete
MTNLYYNPVSEDIFEEIKKEAREEIIKFYNATPAYRAAAEFVELFDSLLSQALQKRDEEILKLLDWRNSGITFWDGGEIVAWVEDKLSTLTTK